MRIIKDFSVYLHENIVMIINGNIFDVQDVETIKHLLQ